MSQKFHKTKEFKALNDKWQKKLKKDGFEDIEDEQGNIDRGSWDLRTPKVLNSYQTKVEYYYKATQFLNDYTFETPLDRAIWTYHVEGIGRREIAKLLQKLKLSKLEHASIGFVIVRLGHEMSKFYSKANK